MKVSLKNILLLNFVFLSLFIYSENCIAADNHMQSASLRVKASRVNPVNRRRKVNARKKRLKDGALNNFLKAGRKKNVIFITFPKAVRINTFRILSHKSINYHTIVLKNGENKAILSQKGAGSFGVNDWVVLNGFDLVTRKLTLVIRSKRRPSIKEIQAFNLKNDFNGDGFNDLVAGAPLHDGGGVNFGRVFVYLGGNNFDTTADLTIDGDEGANFGRSVQGIGDVNGDGFSDFLISAYTHNAGAGTNRGRVWLHLGAATLNSIPDLTLSGDENFAGFGRAISGIGDINSDGFSDFAITAPNHSGGGTGRGRVYIFLGSSTPDTTPDLILSGAEDGDAFGASVAGGKDINGDGFDDYAIGANLALSGVTNPGKAYIFPGGSTLSSTPLQTFTGDEDMGQHGDAVQFPGDVNGDGFQDFTVGASMHDAGGPVDENQGRAYLYLGSSSIDNTADATFDGTESDGAHGFTLPYLGDVNRDGFAEIGVSAPFMDLNGASMSDYGRLFIYNGAASAPSTTASNTIDGTEANANVGLTAARLDLFSLEGQDICVAATGVSTGGLTGNGAVFVYQYDSGSPNSSYAFDATIRQTIDGDESNAFFGNVDSNPS